MPNRKQKFRELAEKRVNNAIKQIELIGNLSNKSSYDYTREEVLKIFKVLRSNVKKAENRFGNSEKNDEKFIL